MQKNQTLEFLEQFRDLKISKDELNSIINKISFGTQEGILMPQHVIHLLESFINKKIDEKDIIDWVNTIWWGDWFECPQEHIESVASVMGELDMLEDIPYLRTSHLTNEEAQYYIDALKNNEDISFKPYQHE